MRHFFAIILVTASVTGCSTAPTDSSELALAPPPAAANAKYLALGDSIAFGFNPNLTYAPPFAGFVGYPEEVAAATGLVLANASCPGETSASFLDATQPDNGCHFKDDFFAQGLKITWGGIPDQMDYALSFLAAHPKTELITLDIGGNDLLLVQAQCGASLLCIGTQLPVTLAKISANITEILFRLRTAYWGPIVVLTQYATNYQDVKQIAALTSMSKATSTVAAPFFAPIADGYGAFASASLLNFGDTCAAGLLIRNPDGTCDKHPSAKGRSILADAVLSVIP